MSEQTKLGRPRKAASELPIYDSMDQCTAATGIPLAVIKAAKKAGSDAFKSNRVYLDRLLVWIFSNEQADSVTDWNQALAQEKTLRERRKRLMEDEQTADRPTIQRGAGKIMAIIFDTLERSFCYELPGSQVGKTEAEMATLAKGVITGLRTSLAQRIETLGIDESTI